MVLPRQDELEVTIFGPGYGECILIHFDRKWIIIDSCVNRQTKRPAALDYLDSLGESPGESVVLVVATHWHDDHIRGLGTIVRECYSATFVCSTAINNREFTKLASLYQEATNLLNGSGIDEFLSIFNILKQRKTPPKFAVSDRRIWHYTSENPNLNCTIKALSPSDAEIANALISISKLMPQKDTYPRRLNTPKQNDSAVVLWVKIGVDNIFLLGADLEEKGNSQMGWSAIVDSNIVDGEKAHIYKSAHHGSITGHYELIWKEMLHGNPWTLITPFSRGQKPLPSEDDVKRITSQTDRAYITTKSYQKKSKRKWKDPFLKKFIARHTRNIRYAEHDCGQVTLRKGITADSNEWKVDLFGNAGKLKNI